MTWENEHVDQALLQERLLSAVSSFFAALAVLVACVGLYGLLAYAVIRRTREIGVRIALGATRRSVLRMIIGEGLVLVLGCHDRHPRHGGDRSAHAFIVVRPC